MKRLWIVLLALALAMASALPTFSLAEGAALAQVGDVIHGFEVKEVGEYPLIDADTVLFEHQKTGAKLLYMANDDTNRAFELSFGTPVPDDTGIPHVFEHATLNGSKKYPSKTLFFNLLYQTYHTFLNAYTNNIVTNYPMASLSEQQLLRYADFYVDCCFHPMIDEDESIFLEEAWHYALDDPEDELTIAGTVYSEMKGSYTLADAAEFNFQKTLFPGSTLGNSYGGLPEKIPEMTWQDLKDYHQTYYHPSNALACLYGDFEDYEAFLELLDGYFAEYDRVAFCRDDPDYVPLTEPAARTFEYGVEAGSEATAIVSYGMVLEDATDADLIALAMATDILASDAFPLGNHLKNELPTATLNCYLHLEGPEPVLRFEVSGVRAGDEAAVKRIIDDSLLEIVEEGLDPAAVDAIAASARIDVQMQTKSASAGVDLLLGIAYFWSAMDDAHGYMKLIEAQNDIEQLANSGAMTDALKKCALHNRRTALVLTTPVPGLKEKQDAALAEHLAQVKATMSGEEIAEIVERTRALAESTGGEDSALVSQLQAVTVQELPEEIQTYDVTDEVGEDSVRRLEMITHVDGLGQALLMLDASSMEQEDLHWFKLYTDLMGALDTGRHSREQLAPLMTRYLYNGEIRQSIGREMGADHDYLRMRASWIAFDEEMEDAYDLVYELLFETQFTDGDALRSAVARIRTDLYNLLNGDPYELMMNRARSSVSTLDALHNDMTQLDYYAFLGDVLDQLEQDPEGVTAHLIRVQNLMNNRTDAISGFAGSEAGRAAHREAADAFLRRLDARPVEKHVYAVTPCADNEAIVADSPVQYNLILASYEQLGLDGFTADLEVVTRLMTDAFLIPMLRDQYGVYDVLHYATTEEIYVCSYCDPNITETFEVYDMLPEAMEALAAEIDQQTLDGYIMSTYAYYAQPTGELSDALSVLLEEVDHHPRDEKLNNMRAIKQITVETLSDYVQVYRNLLDNGLRFTAGGASAINAHKELYEQIVPIS